MTIDDAFTKWTADRPHLRASPIVWMAFQEGWYAREEAEFDELVRRAMPEALATVRGEIPCERMNKCYDWCSDSD